MTDPRELYNEMVLDHSKKPRNHRVIEGDCRSADGDNPLCGDKVTVYLKVEGDQLSDVSFLGRGCAISTASASLMTQAVKGKTAKEAERLFERFHALVTEEPTGEADQVDLGKLRVFSGVRQYPMRVKCATLAWHTLRAAMAEAKETVTTE